MRMDKILPVNKPVGMTSYDVIRRFKQTVHPDYKIGHGGTLDPFADGVLLLLLGHATKKMGELSMLPKTYRAVAKLGARSDTLDVTGKLKIRRQTIDVSLTKEKIQAAANKFVGEIEQTVPNYSAAKIDGVPRYKLARRGETMREKSKKVVIHTLVVESINDDRVVFTTTVSSGTYIRQLSYDLLKSLGIESYLEKLTREKIGEFDLSRCCQITDFSSSKYLDKAVQI